MQRLLLAVVIVCLIVLIFGYRIIADGIYINYVYIRAYWPWSLYYALAGIGLIYMGQAVINTASQ